VPELADSPDAFVHMALPILAGAGYLLRAAGVPERVVPTVVQAVNLALYAGLVAALVRLRRRASSGRVAVLLGVLAAAMGLWIARHPSHGFETALARGDHLLLAGLGGAALRMLPVTTRVGVLVAGSLAVLVSLAGPVAPAIVLAGMAIGVTAERLGAAARAERAALVQAAIMIATLAACRFAWLRDPDIGRGAQGLFAFMLLRHVSWVVDVRRGAGGTLLDYWCYQLFYPCCYGATERYADFRGRNPDPGAFVDDARLFRAAVRGNAYLLLVLYMPFTLSDLLAAPGWLAFAAGYLLIFVRAAFFLMGIWSILEALALGWGVRIHPNFAGILAARSPSQFWYAWRGTMTRWLVEYVYIPLGGNRAHQTRNVFVVFAVSATWHWMGIPFLRADTTAAAFVPVGAWALVNAVVLGAALAWRRRALRLWPAATPDVVRAGAARLGTWAFGGVTATFLAFQGDLVGRFPEFLLRLAGVR
jgi:hypothetical protein